MITRLVCLVLIFVFSHSAEGQIYIEGIAPAEIDTLQKRAEKLAKETKNQEALILIDSISQFYDFSGKLENDQSFLQNQYYCIIKNHQLRLRLKTLTTKESKYIYSLEAKITSLFSEDNIIVPTYLNLVSQLNREVDRDFNLAVDYSERSLSIRRKFFSNERDALANQLVSSGYALSELRKFKDSRKCFQEALEIRKNISPPDTQSVLYSYYPLAVNYYREKNYETGLEIFNEGFELGKDFLPKDHTLYVAFTRAIGMLHHQLGNVQDALEFSLIGLESAKLKNEESQLNIKSHYVAISILYYRLGNLRLANTYADTAIAIMEKNNSIRSLAGSYSNKATYATDLNTKILLTKKALEICPQDPVCQQTEMNIILHNLGDFYARKGNIDIGLNYILKSAKLKETDYDQFGHTLPNSYQALAGIYQHNNQIELAITYQKKALATAKDFRPDTSYYVAIQSSKLGSLYLSNGELNKAEAILLEANEILEKQFGKSNHDLIYNYTHLSKLYTRRSNYQKALKYGKAALQSANTINTKDLETSRGPLLQIARIHFENNRQDSASFILETLLTTSGFQPFRGDEINAYNIPVHEQWLSYAALTKLLFLEDEFLENNQKHILGKIKTTINLIDEVRQYYFFEDSEQQFQNSTSKFFDWAIKKLHTAYKEDMDSEILDLIFHCIEKNKSISLNRNFARYEAHNTEGIPATIFEREKSLILNYENAYKKYQETTAVDSLSKLYIDQMYELQKTKDLFLDSLKQSYPDYYQSRYNQRVIDLETLRSYSKNENRSFILNHWTDSILYQLTVSPIATNLEVIDTKDLSDQISKVQSLVSQPMNANSEQAYTKRKNEFINNSYLIYKTLFKNYSEDSLTFDLTIISDGKLAQFPFDVLLTDETKVTANYKSMPYLIKSHAINYLGSATQHDQLKNNKKYEYSNEYVGFAPNYSPSIFADSISQFRSNTSLSPLLYNYKEVSQTNRLFDGLEFVGDDATVSAFRNISEKAGILHLAMHTTIDDRFPLDSYLNFAQDSTGGDARLYVHEIAKMNLENMLVVLSACETNKGKEIKGEGVLGIARAFQLAACPNLILSNWLVDDRSSSKIIYTFFEGINIGASPSVALRDAKLDFLSKSSKVNSHPAYWAAFSYYGNPDSLKAVETNTNINKIFYGGIALLFAGLCFWIYPKKQ